MWVEEKVPGGKLLCINASFEQDKVLCAKISGDFFLHPEESLLKIESCFDGLSLPLDENALRAKLKHAVVGMTIIGFDIEDLIKLFKRAIS